MEKVIGLFLISLSFLSFAFAEKIVLKSGKKVEGKKIGQTDDYIKIDFHGVSLTYYFEEIESIDGEKVTISSPKQNIQKKDSAHKEPKSEITYEAEETYKTEKSFESTPFQVTMSDKPVWKNDVTEISIPSIPTQGIAHGVEFKVEKASLQNGILKLRQGQDFFPDQEFMIFTFLKKDEIINGKTIIVKPEDGFRVPHIHFKYKVEGKSMPKTEIFMKKYTMKLEFGQTTGNKIQGKIYLCLPDEKKSFVVGTFEAEIK